MHQKDSAKGTLAMAILASTEQCQPNDRLAPHNRLAPNYRLALIGLRTKLGIGGVPRLLNAFTMMGCCRCWRLRVRPLQLITMTSACWPVWVGIGRDAREFEVFGQGPVKWRWACTWLSASFALR